MPQKWQQWMPFNIEKFWSSPSVQAMAHAAQIGYLRLLGAQWQSAEGSVSSDPFDLSEQSGLGDDLWAVHGLRILRKFVVLEDGRLRNLPNYQDWCEARRVFEARKKGAQRTNEARLPYAQREDSGRSADTRTTVVPVSVDVPVLEEGITCHMVAKEVCAKLKMTHDLIFQAVARQAELEIGIGIDADQADALTDRMVKSWLAYIANIPKLHFIRKAQDFFAEGLWRDQAAWPWKERNDGSDKRTSPASDRVNGSLAALTEARRRNGIVGNAGADDSPLPASRPESFDGGLLPGLSRGGGAVRDRSSPPSSSGAPGHARPEILSPAK